MIAASPALLEEAVTALERAQDATFTYYYRHHHRPDKTLSEPYEHQPALYIPVDTFLKERYPEQFQALQDAHQAQLAALAQGVC